MPGRLPAIALGSAVLLHAERTIALVSATLILVTVVVRAAEGQLPIELSTAGLKYALMADERLAQNVDEMQTEVMKLQRDVQELADRLDVARRRS